jgi:hypothetical protein
MGQMDRGEEIPGDHLLKTLAAFEPFLAHQIREAFGFIGSPSGSQPAPETKRNPKSKRKSRPRLAA